MTTEQRAILERLNNHVFDVLSTNYGVPARVLNAALADAMRRVEAEYLPLCAHCLRPGEEMMRAKGIL